MSDDEMAACDALVMIPMSGQAESLNVASAAAMCLFASQNARVGE
jgi:TrmH family RNA methyltransferase